jgi:glycosyltransferase involved in cell wall biosynthesis
VFGSRFKNSSQTHASASYADGRSASSTIAYDSALLYDSPVPAGKIAFIKQGSASNVNASVASMLAQTFPEHRVDVIDTGDWRDTIAYKPLNRLCVYKEFARLILSRRKPARDYLPLTRYYYDHFRRSLIGYLTLEKYAFTFQTESHFDASVPGLPHFVYTPYVNRANLQQPGFDRRDLMPPSWIDLERRIFRNAARVFTFSRYVSRCIVEEYGCPVEKVVCVGVGGNARPELEETADPARYARRHIVFVGRIWEQKGGPTLAEAFKRVLTVHSDARLTIVGCSPSLDVPNCHVVGKVTLGETNQYYREGSIFCMPTTLEAFGISFIEAMSHQLPVIGTSIGAMPDFIEEGRNGYLVRPFDVETLAARLIELLGDPDRCRTMGVRSRELVRERFNWKQVGATIRHHIDGYRNGEAI